VGWAGVGMLVLSLTGLWLSGRATACFAQRCAGAAPAMPSISNLHYLLGFWIALPLTLVSFTGIYPRFRRRRAPHVRDRPMNPQAGRPIFAGNWRGGDAAHPDRADVARSGEACAGGRAHCSSPRCSPSAESVARVRRRSAKIAVSALPQPGACSCADPGSNDVATVYGQTIATARRRSLPIRCAGRSRGAVDSRLHEGSRAASCGRSVRVLTAAAVPHILSRSTGSSSVAQASRRLRSSGQTP